MNSAVSLGAKFVSNSYGGSESSSDPTYRHRLLQPPGRGGHRLGGRRRLRRRVPGRLAVRHRGRRHLAEHRVQRARLDRDRLGQQLRREGTGSGCSADDAKPSWQTDTGCAKRTDNDVSAVADPNTGVAVYDTYSEGGWLEVGGTSASSPIIASVFALAGTPAAGTYPSSYPYSHTANLFDVTSGSNGSCSPAYLCTGEVGYDGPTGLGTPDGTAAFTSGSTTATR